MKHLLMTVSTAAILAVSLSALASGPSPFAGTPLDYHIGEGSCVFPVKGDLPGTFVFYGVPSDGQHAAMCDTIVSAFNANRAIGWGEFPTPLTVPCDPNFCVSNGQHYNTAVRISNFVGSPAGD
jgi:hypothetical protein